jgi:phosphoglucomutase
MCPPGLWPIAAVSHAIRKHAWSIDARHAILVRSNEGGFLGGLNLHQSQCGPAPPSQTEEWRADASDYIKNALTFLSVLCIAAALVGLKLYRNWWRLPSLLQIQMFRPLTAG